MKNYKSVRKISAAPFFRSLYFCTLLNGISNDASVLGNLLSKMSSYRTVINGFHFCSLVLFADFSKYSNGFEGVVFLIDEIHIEFNSLESKNIDPSVMTEIAQQRKQRKHIVGTSQVFGRIAKPFREQFKYVVLCRCLWGVLQYNTLIDGERAMVDDDGHLEAETVKRYFWWHKPELYDSYNTYAKIIRSKDRRIQSGYGGGN